MEPRDAEVREPPMSYGGDVVEVTFIALIFVR